MPKRITGKWSPAERTELVEQFLASGVRQKEFCLKNNLGLSTLQFWLTKYRRTHNVNNNALVEDAQMSEINNRQVQSFVPLTFKQPAQEHGASRLVIEFPNHVIVRLSGPIDCDLLIQLIQAGGY